MNSDEEINQLREKIQNTISEAGISNLLTTLANETNYKLELNESSITLTLNSLHYAILRLMMIDYSKNNFNI